MNKNDMFAFFKMNPVCKGISDKGLSHLTEKATYKIIPAKKIFIRQDEEADAVYFIYSGLVRVFPITEHGEERTRGLHATNDIVGEMAVVDKLQRSAFVETMQESKVLVINKHDFINIIYTNPIIALNIMLLLSHKTRAVNEEIEARLFLELKDRTWRVLQTLSFHFRNQQITLSQEELALIVGASRSRITEVLKALEKQKLITLSHRKISVL